MRLGSKLRCLPTNCPDRNPFINSPISDCAILASMSILKKRTAITVVHGFYFLMFLQPIVGLVQAMVYKSVEIRLFGVFGVGWLRELDKMWLDIFSMIHSIGAGALSLFVMFHLGAALKHRFIDRDEIMGRMSPFKRAHKSK